MAKELIKRGLTSKTAKIFFGDSSVGNGAGLTGLLFSSAGLTAYYIREGDAAATAIALQTATVGTWTTRGFREVDATNMPGLYEVGIPDAALASGASVVIMYKGATNMVPTALEYELTGPDLQDATSFGLSRLDAAVSSVAAAVWAVGARTLTAFGFSVTASTVSDKTGYTVSTVQDKTGYALTAGEHTAIAADAQTGLTAQGYTTTRAGYLDTLNGLVTAVWAAATRTLSAFGFSVTVGTNNDKTGYTASTVSDKTGYSLAVAPPTAAQVIAAFRGQGIALNPAANSYDEVMSLVRALCLGKRVNTSPTTEDVYAHDDLTRLATITYQTGGIALTAAATGSTAARD